MKRHRKWKLVLLCSFHGFNIRLSFVGTQIAAFNRKYYCVWNFCHVTKLALCARNIAISYNLSLNFRNLQKVRNNFALFYICVYAPSKSRLFYFVYMKRLYCWWGSSVRSIHHLSRDRPLSCLWHWKALVVGGFFLCNRNDHYDKQGAPRGY